MTPDERRQAIIDATLPLLLANGPELSTREIAQAAGVAEGTIFRAFETKSDIIHATIHAAMEPTTALDALAALPSDQSLEQRVIGILAVLSEEIGRTRALFTHLAGVGFGPRQPHPPSAGKPHPGPHEGRLRMFAGTGEALEPYADQLSVEVSTASRLLNALAFASSFGAADDSDRTSPTTMAKVVLHGIAEGEK